MCAGRTASTSITPLDWAVPPGVSFKMLAERRLSSDTQYLHAHSKVLSVLKIRSPVGEPNHWAVVTQECYICISRLIRWFIHNCMALGRGWRKQEEALVELCQRDMSLVDALPLCLFASCLLWSSLPCSLHSPIVLSCLFFFMVEFFFLIN